MCADKYYAAQIALAVESERLCKTPKALKVESCMLAMARPTTDRYGCPDRPSGGGKMMPRLRASCQRRAMPLERSTDCVQPAISLNLHKIDEIAHHFWQLAYWTLADLD